MPRKDTRLLKRSYKVDPYQGVAALLCSTVPVGYEFVRLKRTARVAHVWYRRVQQEAK